MKKFLVNSPMMKNSVEFEKVLDMLSFLSSQFSVVPSYYGSSVSIDVFSINVVVNSGITCNMFIPVDADWNCVLPELHTWLDCIDKM